MVEEEVVGINRMLWPVDLDPPTDTTRYVWSVKAVTMDDNPYRAENAGFSPARTFTVIPNIPVIPPVAGPLAANQSIFAGLNGEFEVIVTEVTTNQNTNTHTGKGTVFIQWLNARVEVAFSAITVDLNRNLLEGEITAAIHDEAPEYPLDWGLEAAANLGFTNQITGNVLNWIENKTGQTIPFDNLTEYTTPVKMPLGIILKDGSESAINEMVFRPAKSEFNMTTARAVPPSWGTTRLGFIAKNIKFHPTSIEMPPARN